MEAINIAATMSRFSELISRASAGELIAIQRRNRTMAVLIGLGEYKRLERMAQAILHLARVLGQDEVVLQRVQRGDIHPAMAAFGPWREEDDLEKPA